MHCSLIVCLLVILLYAVIRIVRKHEASSIFLDLLEVSGLWLGRQFFNRCQPVAHSCCCHFQRWQSGIKILFCIWDIFLLNGSFKSHGGSIKAAITCLRLGHYQFPSHFLLHSTSNLLLCPSKQGNCRQSSTPTTASFCFFNFSHFPRWSRVHAFLPPLALLLIPWFR